MAQFYLGLEWLRAISAFFIVGCHIGLLTRTPSAAKLTWFCDTNVAVFALVSGFLMADSILRQNEFRCGEYIKKRIKRLLPIYCVWTLFYLLMRMSFDLLFDGGLDPQYTSSRFWLGVLFHGDAACHLWFVIDLLYVQILWAILWRCGSFLRSVPFMILMGGGCVMVSAFFPELGSFSYYFLRLLGFVTLGIAMRKMELTDVNLKLVLVAGLLAVGIHVGCGNYIPRFIRDLFVVLPVVAGAIMIPCAPRKWVSWLSRLSFAVFLWHPFFAVGCATVIAKLVPTPYGCCVILFDWVCVYAMALAASWVTDRCGLARWIH